MSTDSSKGLATNVSLSWFLLEKSCSGLERVVFFFFFSFFLFSRQRRLGPLEKKKKQQAYNWDERARLLKGTQTECMPSLRLFLSLGFPKTLKAFPFSFLFYFFPRKPFLHLHASDYIGMRRENSVRDWETQRRNLRSLFFSFIFREPFYSTGSSCPFMRKFRI